MNETPIASPCVRICHLAGEICVGCKRTIDQIRRWGKMTDEEKLKVIEGLDK